MGYNEDWWIVEAMIEHGGNFVKCLGRAFRAADLTNFRKLKKAFPEYWELYKSHGYTMYIRMKE